MLEVGVALLFFVVVIWIIVKLKGKKQEPSVEVTVEEYPSRGESSAQPSPTHREDAIIKARELLASDPLIFDTETTGISREDQIIEIAIIDVSGFSAFESLVRPSVPVHPEAQEVHQIPPEEFAEAPTFWELMPQLREVIGDKPMAAFNYEFDLRMMRQSLAAENRRFPRAWTRLGGNTVETNCIMKLYAEYYGQWNAYHGNYRWQGQAKALEQCGIKIEGNAHRAAVDALGALALLKHMAESDPV